MAIKPIFRIVLISIASFAGIMDAFSADFRDSYTKGSIQADTLKSKAENWTAAELWAQSISQNLKLKGDAIVIEGNILVEDDAAGIGSIRERTWDTISTGTVFRKYLNIAQKPLNDAVIAMMLYPVAPTEPLNGAKLEFRVNGRAPIIYEIRHFWTSVPVPANYLKAGENVIEVKVQGNQNKFRVPVALHSNFKYGSKESPPRISRSERSTNNGKSWTKLRIGAPENTGAEYPIRLKLQEFNERAWLQTPVINLAESGTLLFPARIDYADIVLDTLQTRGSKWQVRIRGGNKHQPESGDWSDWKLLNGSVLNAELKKRFIQLEFSFEQNAGQLSPELKGLQVNSRWQDENPDLRKRILIADLINKPISRSSFDFEYEDPGITELQDYRKKFELDKVVAGSLTEWEKIRKLRGWVARSWDWYLPNSNMQDLIVWNASEILEVKNKLGDTQKIGGNCLHYAIVLAQACQSFGIPARIVSTNFSIWGGHELVEVWSREYEKWIMVDPNFDTMFYNRKTGIPQNTLELHQLFLSTYYPGHEIIDRDQWSFEDRDRRSEKVNPDLLPINMEVGGNAYSGKIREDYVWWKVSFEKSNPGYSGGYGFFNTAEVRWLPRNNWLSKAEPNPITHGRTHWGWDGYYIWTDSQTPETPEHRNYVRRESDMYGKLYTVDLSAEAAEQNQLKINLATISPAFSHFEIFDNSRKKELKGTTFVLNLVPGINLLEVRTVDKLGNKGGISSLKVNYIPDINH